MLEPRSSGAVSGSAAPARRRLAPANALLASVTIRAEPPLPLAPRHLYTLLRADAPK